MTRYLWLNLIFLGFSGAVAWWQRRRFVGRTKYILTMTGLLLVLTIVFDNVIIGLGIVSYHTGHILGWYAYKAPIEDFAYTLGAVLLIVSLWDAQR